MSFIRNLDKATSELNDAVRGLNSTSRGNLDAVVVLAVILAVGYFFFH